MLLAADHSASTSPLLRGSEWVRLAESCKIPPSRGADLDSGFDALVEARRRWVRRCIAYHMVDACLICTLCGLVRSLVPRGVGCRAGGLWHNKHTCTAFTLQ
jgi:hypothetical protein